MNMLMEGRARKQIHTNSITDSLHCIYELNNQYYYIQIIQH